MPHLNRSHSRGLDRDRVRGLSGDRRGTRLLCRRPRRLRRRHEKRDGDERLEWCNQLSASRDHFSVLSLSNRRMNMRMMPWTRASPCVTGPARRNHQPTHDASIGFLNDADPALRSPEIARPTPQPRKRNNRGKHAAFSHVSARADAGGHHQPRGSRRMVTASQPEPSYTTGRGRASPTDLFEPPHESPRILE